MERFFQILAAVLAGIAAYFLWTGNGDGVFIAGVLGAVSFFLSIRVQIKERNCLREQAAEQEMRGQLAEDNSFDDEIATEREREEIENRI